MDKPIPLNIIFARGRWYIYVRGTKLRIAAGLTGDRRAIDEWISENRGFIESTVAKSDTRFLEDRKSWRSEAANQIHSVTSRRAKARGISYELDARSIMSMLEQSSDRCSVSGVDFNYLPKDEGSTWHRRPYMPSIDRLNNGFGYNKNNVRVVAVCVNISINEWGEDVFWNVVKSASNKLENVLQNT